RLCHRRTLQVHQAPGEAAYRQEDDADDNNPIANVFEGNHGTPRRRIRISILSLAEIYWHRRFRKGSHLFLVNRSAKLIAMVVATVLEPWSGLKCMRSDLTKKAKSIERANQGPRGLDFP